MVRLLNRVLFSLNLGFAIALSLTILGQQQSVRFRGDIPVASPGIFQRFVVAANHVTNHVPWALMGVGIELMTLTVILSLILLMFSRVLDETVAFTCLAGFFVITAMPLAWFFVVLVEGSSVATSYGVILEFAVLGGILYLSRKNVTPFWFLSLGLHYLVWLWFAWAFAQGPLTVPFDWRPPIILSFIAPSSGYGWLIHLKRIRPTLSQSRLLT